MTQSRTIKVRNLIAYGRGLFLVGTFAMYYSITVVGLSSLMAALLPRPGKGLLVCEELTGMPYSDFYR